MEQREKRRIDETAEKNETDYMDCHIHIFMDGVDFKKARERHAYQVDEAVIHEHFRQYRECGTTWLRDGGDALGVSMRAREIAPEYGITYRTPIFAIHRNGHYGGIVGRGFDTIEEYAELVKEIRCLGGHFVKIMTTGIMDFNHAGMITGEALPFELVCEMVHIAHEEGFSVMAHTNGAQAVREAAQADVDSVEHGNFQDRESLQAMKANDCVWVPTLVTVRNLHGKGRFPDVEVEKIMQCQRDTVRAAREIGVSMAVGTDGGAWMVPHGSSVAQEYEGFFEILGESCETRWLLRDGNRRIREKF